MFHGKLLVITRCTSWMTMTTGIETHGELGDPPQIRKYPYGKSSKSTEFRVGVAFPEAVVATFPFRHSGVSHQTDFDDGNREFTAYG